LKVVADEGNRAAQQALSEFTTAANALKSAAQDLDLSIELAAGSAGLRAQRDTARIVFKTCNGEAGIKVKLERWGLAGELDRVTAAANVHLGRMTNLRYKLGRAAGVKGGLTLEVFDSHTGRSRATSSLSGGAQFQASLSLALGLADVVSHGGVGSGKQFEALFVDEGFGSLDPNALDDAIGALSLLHAAGRMVGAITHVEAMKERLHVGIEVKPLADGRGSTLVVNP
jgi:exonuclease SbcC